MKAFSLPELIVVLVLIGILTTLGVSRYNAYVASARQAEAKVNLTHIASLQGIYRSQHLTYKVLDNVGAKTSGGTDCTTPLLNNGLGFSPQDCENLRYGYKTTGTVTAKKFTAQAKSRTSPNAGEEIYPGCDATDKSDTWTMNHKLNLKNPHPIVKKCSE